MISKRRPDRVENSEKELLTEKKQEIAKLICQQYSTKQIASLIDHTPRTIEAYRLRLMEKISAHNSAGIMIYAIQRGFF